MAKARKTRRAKKKRTQSLQRARGSAQARTVAIAPETAVAAPQPESVGFAEEYQYVIADLKRIFVLAAAMLVLLIVLALVLR